MRATSVSSIGTGAQRAIAPPGVEFARHLMTSMPRSLIAPCLGLLALGPTLVSQSQSSSPGPPMRGYTPARAQAQRDIERTFQRLPSAGRITDWHRYFTAEPHPATSPRTKAIAERIAQAWKEQGLEDVVIRRYDVLSSNPREVRVEMVSPRRYVPSLKEDAYREDPDTAHKDISRAWLSFSASGEVTAPVVYANSGNPEDYDRLRAAGIDPKGKIVIVRYSNPYSYRGFKALTAQREGAAGHHRLLGSDGGRVHQGRGVPEGPVGTREPLPARRHRLRLHRSRRSADTRVGLHARRAPHHDGGSGIGAHHHGRAALVARREADSRKPGRPAGAEGMAGGAPDRVSARRRGPRAPQNRHADRRAAQLRRRGAASAAASGPTSGSRSATITTRGYSAAWTPSSGTATMMDLTRSLGEMLKQGRRPRRTLVFCAWDGEEVTLTGSTEWGEHFAAELKQKLVAYLNVDSSASGPRFSASAVGSLAPLLVDVARDLEDPSGWSLYDAMRKPAAGAARPRRMDCCRSRRWYGRASGADPTTRCSSTFSRGRSST